MTIRQFIFFIAIGCAFQSPAFAADASRGAGAMTGEQFFSIEAHKALARHSASELRKQSSPAEQLSQVLVWMPFTTPAPFRLSPSAGGIIRPGIDAAVREAVRDGGIANCLLRFGAGTTMEDKLTLLEAGCNLRQLDSIQRDYLVMLDEQLLREVEQSTAVASLMVYDYSMKVLSRDFLPDEDEISCLFKVDDAIDIDWASQEVSSFGVDVTSVFYRSNRVWVNNCTREVMQKIGRLPWVITVSGSAHAKVIDDQTPTTDEGESGESTANRKKVGSIDTLDGHHSPWDSCELCSIPAGDLHYDAAVVIGLNELPNE